MTELEDLLRGLAEGQRNMTQDELRSLLSRQGAQNVYAQRESPIRKFIREVAEAFRGGHTMTDPYYDITPEQAARALSLLERYAEQEGKYGTWAESALDLLRYDLCLNVNDDGEVAA